MLKFFRKIRQQLITENRVSKYLLYAIGEIALVVIGILIALSVNNWNEERKSKIKVDTFKEKIISDLIKDTLNIETQIGSADDYIKTIIRFLNREISQSGSYLIMQ